ncbi:MAG: hypothetical protein ACRENE_24525, partial [Polyangiaceae bacterium]
MTGTLKNSQALVLFAFVLVASGAVAAACGGSQGPEGPPGPAGPPGDAGLTGSQGSQGAAGEGGARGTTGGSGEAGSQGATGEAGPPDMPIIISDTAKLGLEIAPVALQLAGRDSDQLELIGTGSYLVNAVADCASCHGSGSTYLAGACNAPADGGAPACSGASFSLPAGPPGGDAGLTTVYARNLTPDPTTGLTLSFTQFEQVMRTGDDFKTSQTHTLAVMPWAAFRWMSSYDIASIYFYLQ